jgi:MYXO-CTERM domain-containing protein
VAERTTGDAGSHVPPEVTWLLALGFLGVVVARRLRPD